MASKKKDITGKPNKKVSNPSISRGDGNYVMTAKWKVGSALTTTTNARRATSLDVQWRVTYRKSGETKYHVYTRTTNRKAIGTTTVSLNLNNFVDDNDVRHTLNDFFPQSGKPYLLSATCRIYGRNKKGRSKKYAKATYKFTIPEAPAISSLEHDRESGEVFFDITAYDEDKKHNPRRRTDFDLRVEDTRKEGSERVRTESGNFTEDKKEWNEDTPEEDKFIIDVTDRYLLGDDQFVKVTVKARTLGVRGTSSNDAEQTVVFAYPNAATINEDKIHVDKLDGGRADTSGRVTIPIVTNTDYETRPTTNVRLQVLRSTTATTAQQAAAMGNDWEDSDAVDDGDCDGLAMAVADLIPSRGTHTWVRVKSWNRYEDLFYRYSVAAEIADLYVDPASAADNMHLLSLTSGDDGTSLIAYMGWTATEDPTTGTELSWSDDENAWKSTKEPETYEFTRSDGAVTIDGVAYIGTATVHIQGLTQGTTYYVKARRYLDQEDIDRTYGGYSELLTAIPVSSPTSVVLTAPETLARGSDLPLTWTFDSEATQTEWYILYGTEYTADAETGQRTYTIGEDSWVMSGTDAYGSCNVAWSDLEPLLDSNGEIGLAVRMGTGGTLVTSENVVLRVVDPPVLSLSVPATMTAQPLEFMASCNVNATLTVIIRAGELSGVGMEMTGGNVGDELVHQDQPAGDVVWQSHLFPVWTESDGTYTATVRTSTEGGYLEFIDGGTYTVFVQATDDDTGLVSETMTAQFSVAWANQAPSMEVNEEPAAIVVTPSDTTDEDGNRVRQCEIQLAAPSGALGTETYNVYRVTPDNAYLIAEGCGLTERVVDPYAPFGGEEIAYRVCVVTVDGDVDWIDYDYVLSGRDMRIDFGDEYVELPYNLSLSDGYEKDFEARRKLDGSIDGYWNDGVMRSGSYSSDLIRIYEQDKAARVRELARYAGPAFVRLPDGCAFQADVQVSSIGGARRDAALAVQITATEIDLTDEYMAELPDRESEDEEG